MKDLPKRHNKLRKQIREVSSVPAVDTQWLWYPYIPFGALTLLAGDPGMGKSFITCDIAAKVSAGLPLPGQDPLIKRSPQKVLMISAEDDIAATLRPRLESLGANLNNVFALEEAFLLGPTAEKDLLEICREMAITVVFLDPLVSYLGGKTDMFRSNEVREKLQHLAVVARKADCAVLVVHHLRKGTGGPAIHSFSGSGDFAAGVRSALLVGYYDDERVMAHAKCNLARLGPSFAFNLGEEGFAWNGEVDASADDLKRKLSRGARSNARVQNIQAFIKDILKAGPVPSNMVYQRGEDEGFSKDQLKAAKKNIVAVYKEADQWMWALT